MVGTIIIILKYYNLSCFVVYIFFSLTHVVHFFCFDKYHLLVRHRITSVNFNGAYLPHPWIRPWLISAMYNNCTALYINALSVHFQITCIFIIFNCIITATL